MTLVCFIMDERNMSPMKAFELAILPLAHIFAVIMALSRVFSGVKCTFTQAFTPQASILASNRSPLKGLGSEWTI